MSSKGKLTSASQLQVGMAVFKWKDRDTTYHDGLGDFHHIGLVCSVNPVEIIHASSAAGKVTTDTSIKNWTHWGALTEVPVDQQDGPAQENNQRTVTAESGETVFMRYKPSKKMKYVARVPVGAIVDVLSESGEWSLIDYNGKTGYMMTKFLK